MLTEGLLPLITFNELDARIYSSQERRQKMLGEKCLSRQITLECIGIGYFQGQANTETKIITLWDSQAREAGKSFVSDCNVKVSVSG